MSKLHTLAGLAATLLAFHAGTAAAQVYKWVDERGQVNYSSQPPVDSKSTVQVAVVEDRVSVYTPDATLLREIEADRQRASRAVQEKPEAYKPAVAMIGSPAAPAPSAAVEPVVYDYPVMVVGGFRPQRPLHKVPQVRLPAGTIAGTSVGLFGIMPGSSAPVPGTWTSTPPRPAPRHAHRPAPRHPWER